MKIKVFTAITFFAVASTVFAASDIRMASQYFTEVKAICEKDGGQLWGISLCGPILLVEPGSRRIIANQADLENKLQQQGAVFTGALPVEINIANTSIEWAGVHWSMLLWPLPDGTAVRLKLLLHESFHRVQAELGFPQNNPSNAHLDTPEGRTWMRLEWLALESALTKKGKDQSAAIMDALTFRAYRRLQFPGSSDQERELEMNEGLAEYTGVRLATTQPEALAIAALRGAIGADSFVRSFAYANGPAYGILLDQVSTFWKRNLTPDHDLADLLRTETKIGFPVSQDADVQKAAAKYNGERILAEEIERDKQRQLQLTTFRERLIEGPVLILPLKQPNVQFDPGKVYPLGDQGTVYPEARVSDHWGVLNAQFGALVDAKWTTVQIPAPKDPLARPLFGEGFMLDLAAGWHIEAAEREGDYIAVRSSAVEGEPTE